MQNLKAKIEDCVKTFCSNYTVTEVTCSSLNNIGAGVYVITDGKNVLTGYSNNLENRLSRICRGDLRINQITRLFMANFENIAPNLSRETSVNNRLIMLREEISKLANSLSIIIVKCPSMNLRELHKKLTKCLSTNQSTPQTQ